MKYTLIAAAIFTLTTTSQAQAVVMDPSSLSLPTAVKASITFGETYASPTAFFVPEHPAEAAGILHPDEPLGLALRQ